jgi:hypothetical protein
MEPEISPLYLDLFFSPIKSEAFSVHGLAVYASMLQAIMLFCG